MTPTTRVLGGGAAVGGLLAVWWVTARAYAPPPLRAEPPPPAAARPPPAPAVPAGEAAGGSVRPLPVAPSPGSPALADTKAPAAVAAVEKIGDGDRKAWVVRREGRVVARISMGVSAPGTNLKDAAARDDLIGAVFAADAEARRQGATALGAFVRTHPDDEIAALALADALPREIDPNVAEELAWHLSGSPRDDSFSAFLVALERHSDQEVRWALATGASKLVLQGSYEKELAAYALGAGLPAPTTERIADRRARLRGVLERMAARDPDSTFGKGVRRVLDRFPGPGSTTSSGSTK